MNEYYKIFLSEQFLEFLRSTFFSWVRLIYSRLNYVIFINETVHSIESYEKYTGIYKWVASKKLYLMNSVKCTFM
jgi:hypothetical protein